MIPRWTSREEGDRPQERLEALLAERRRELEQHAVRFEEAALDLERREELLRDERMSLERLLRRSTAELEAREAELVQFGHEASEREARLKAGEAELARRRGELGAVELKRAALEQRELALEARGAEIDEREAQLAEMENGVRDASGDDQPEGPGLLFVPGAAYRLVEAEPGSFSVDATLELEGEEYTVARLGASPLPGDSRRCAYLVRGAPRLSDGSS